MFTNLRTHDSFIEQCGQLLPRVRDHTAKKLEPNRDRIIAKYRYTSQ